MEISKVVVFNTGNEEYAIPIEHVISIEKLENINVTPKMPPYMKGVVKVRGELIPVLDMNFIFYHEETEVDANCKLIVVQSDELSSALIVKAAKEILDIKEEQLKSIPVGAFQSTKYFTAVISTNERLITIIQPNLLISNLEDISLIKEEIICHQ